jgi:hypothetical protein
VRENLRERKATRRRARHRKNAIEEKCVRVRERDGGRKRNEEMKSE